METDSPEARERCESVIAALDELYLKQIPKVIQDGTAFISFHAMFALLEGLAGYRYPDLEGDGNRFRSFIEDYLPPEYRGRQDALWDLRNGMQHAAVPRNFSLMHLSPQSHLSTDQTGVTILNADSLFSAIHDAALRYFEEVRTQSERRDAMIRRTADPKGGLVVLRRVQVPYFGPQWPSPPWGGTFASGGISGTW